MNPISTIENFDDADGFFGQGSRRNKRWNYQGHEVTRRKTLSLLRDFLRDISRPWWLYFAALVVYVFLIQLSSQPNVVLTLISTKGAIAAGAATCSPHSVFSDPDQRPARALSPGRIALVQWVHPMLG
jgi:hypothetical protein